jgi:hypothetical protein
MVPAMGGEFDAVVLVPAEAELPPPAFNGDVRDQDEVERLEAVAKHLSEVAAELAAATEAAKAASPTGPDERLQPRRLRWLAVTTSILWTIACFVGAMGASTRLDAWLDGREGWSWIIVRNAVDPITVFAWAVGLVALLTFFALLDRATSMRVPIAATVVILFIGFLVFPAVFSSATPTVFRDKFIWAFSLIIGFYFATEAAVQITKSVQQRKAADGGSEPASVSAVGETPGDVGNITV